MTEVAKYVVEKVDFTNESSLDLPMTIEQAKKLVNEISKKRHRAGADKGVVPAGDTRNRRYVTD